ncbi:hypothetical protein H2248_010205 [Termitomyces sp. 'cryptogamus']|nr:hypothetical protein H2248_010205 [Termitomyces sp. 'cryptogamus']
MNWCFFFDECTDIATPQEAQEAQEMVTIAMDVIRNPDKERPHGEFIIGEATRHCHQSVHLKGARHQFIETLAKFTASFVQQAQDRAQSYIRNIGEYSLVRRETIGARPSFVVLEFGLNLPG